MSIDAGSRAEHGVFRPLAGEAQLGQQPARRSYKRQSCPHHGTEERRQRHRAVDKGENVHIAMGTVVPSVHQAGFGGGVHLIQQGSGRQRRDVAGEFIVEKISYQLPYPAGQLLGGVRTVAGAFPHRAATDQTGTLAPAQPFAPQRNAVPVQHVDVEQPAQGVALLDSHGHAFNRLRRCLDDQEEFEAGDGAFFFFMDDGDGGSCQLAFNQSCAQKKRLFRQGVGFVLSGNVQGEGD